MAFYQIKPNSTLSTADKVRDIEETQKKYAQLVAENNWLKEQIQQKNRSQQREAPYYPHLNFHSPSRADHTTDHQENLHCAQCCPIQASTTLDSEYNEGHDRDIAKWTMLELNAYLSNKLDRLRNQYQRQRHILSKIRSSDKWTERNHCTFKPMTCYEEKYLQLLRVRSPFY